MVCVSCVCRVCGVLGVLLLLEKVAGENDRFWFLNQINPPVTQLMFVHVVGHLADQIHGWQAPNLGGRFNGAKYTEWADAWQPNFQKRCDETDFQQRRSHPAMLTPRHVSDSMAHSPT